MAHHELQARLLCMRVMLKFAGISKKKLFDLKIAQNLNEMLFLHCAPSVIGLYTFRSELNRAFRLLIPPTSLESDSHSGDIFKFP
jgi:hypothetical protein